jgi:hypothetical protein
MKQEHTLPNRIALGCTRWYLLGRQGQQDWIQGAIDRPVSKRVLAGTGPWLLWHGSRRLPPLADDISLASAGSNCITPFSTTGRINYMSPQ